MHHRLLYWLLVLMPVVLSRPMRADAIPGVSTVFLIVMENHDWDTIKGSDKCPYINTKLLPQAAYANRYFNPKGIHPSEPNYVWLVSGTNFGILDDHSPATNTRNTTNHLAWLMDLAGVSWKNYAEDISGKDIPLKNTGNYAVRHVPFLFFENINTNKPYVLAHIRPYSELVADLLADTVPRFCFITPNLTNDMHNLASGSASTRTQGDDWLSTEIPRIQASPAYQRGGLIIVTWDEGSDEVSDGPIGLILLSNRIFAKGFNSSVILDHSDTLRTIQDILGVQPYLGAAARATGLGVFFKHLRVESRGVDSAGVHVAVRDAVVGKTYRVEAASTADHPVWSPLDERVASTATVEFTEPAGQAEKLFYRVTEH